MSAMKVHFHVTMAVSTTQEVSAVLVMRVIYWMSITELALVCVLLSNSLLL